MASASHSQRRAATRRGAKSRPKRVVGAGRIKWDRLGRTVLVVVIGLVVVSYYKPISHYFKQRSTANDVGRELNSLEQENRGLKARVKQSRDPLVSEAEARRLGMVRKGERLILIKGLR